MVSRRNLTLVGVLISGLLVVTSARKEDKCITPTTAAEQQPADPSEEDPQVCIEDGCLRGIYLGGYGTGTFEAFVGIPFAKPPVGKLRFANPVPNDPWREKGIYNATLEKSICVQKNELIPKAEVQGSEDCLYLNVYRPKIKDSGEAALPVMVYIHGGGYFSGSIRLSVLGPEYFMNTGRVVLVTLQYRLGVFGFLSTGDEKAPGNFGLKDQSLALKWVKKNIGKFGGNPELVTIFGQSAGGGSVHMHMMSPLSAGLFSRAIVMSGMATAPWNYPLKEPLELARRQVEVVGVPCAKNLTSQQVVDVLRNVDATVLSDSISRMKVWSVDPLTLYRPVVEEPEWSDQAFLIEDPRVSWQKGNYQQVPWMTGFLPNDGAVRAIAITSNKQLLKELNANITTILPLLMEREPSDELLAALKSRFFPESQDDEWITSQNAQRLVDLYTEVAFLFPLHSAVKQHVTFADTQQAPVSVYKFNFKGRYSYSLFYTFTQQDFGVVHCDELIYLFRSPALFPDFPPESAEARMSQGLVQFFIDFAINGVATQLKPYRACDNGNQVSQSMDCDVLEFINAAEAGDSAVEPSYEVRVVSGQNEDMFAFWKKYYFSS